MNEKTELSNEKSLKEICAEAVVRKGIKDLLNSTVILSDPMNMEEFIATKTPNK